MQIPIEEQVKSVINECYARRNFIMVSFAIVSMLFLGAGTVWPKDYTSFAIIHIEDKSILQPLMTGRAVITDSADYLKNAREIINGDSIMRVLAEKVGWMDDNPSPLRQEKIIQDLRKRVGVNKAGKNMLRISYTDTDQLRTYETASVLTDLYIAAGEEAKIMESQSAYVFINDQATKYLLKLQAVEQELGDYRSDNPNARPGSAALVTTRINSLQSRIEKTTLDLREAEIRASEITLQLSGETAETISKSKEGQYRERINALQSRLETLRLDFTDTHPDVIRIKHQIDDLRDLVSVELDRMHEVRRLTKAKGELYVDEGIKLNPLYHSLRADLSASQTQQATLKTRLRQLNELLAEKYQLARHIQDGEVKLSQLTRDYKVNEEIYQDLLRRKENARVSKSLDIEKQEQGLAFKIQEPASFPHIPTGMRFVHFIILGLVLGIVLPIAYVYLIFQLDPKVRYLMVLTKELNLPVIAEVPHFVSLSEEKSVQVNLIRLIIAFLCIVLVFVVVGTLKVTGSL